MGVRSLVIASAASALVLAATMFPSAQQVYSAKDSGITLPVVVSRVHVDYTEEAMQKRIQGTVVLDCDILADGTVGAVLVSQSLDKVYGLDEQAIDAVKQWTFRPGTKDGKAVPVRVSVEVKFTLARPPQR